MILKYITKNAFALALLLFATICSTEEGIASSTNQYKWNFSVYDHSCRFYVHSELLLPNFKRMSYSIQLSVGSTPGELLRKNGIEPNQQYLMLLPRIYEKSEELKLLPHHEEYKGTISLNGIKMKRFTSDMWNGFIMSGDEIDKEVQNGTFLNSLLEAELDTGEKLRLTIPEHGYEFRNRLFKSCAALLEPPVETK